MPTPFRALITGGLPSHTPIKFVVIIVDPKDETQKEYTKHHNAAVTHYKGEGLSPHNAKEQFILGSTGLRVGKGAPLANAAVLAPAGPFILVVTGHGGIHHLFGTSPATEDAACQAFGQVLTALAPAPLLSVVLDCCYSGVEDEQWAAVLADKAEHEYGSAREEWGMDEYHVANANCCPARILSNYSPTPLGGMQVPVFGVNGRAAEGFISHEGCAHKRCKSTYEDGVVTFSAGVVAQVSKDGPVEVEFRPSSGLRLPQSQQLIAPYDHRFASGKPITSYPT